MRTDITIDRKQVKCPNASMLGFGKWKAQVGNLVTYRVTYTDGSSREETGRMVGRIAYGSNLTTGGSLRNHLVLLSISSDLTHTMERWIDPKDVVRIHDIDEEYLQIRSVMNWFLSADLTKAPVEEIRQCLSHGSRTLDSYRDYKAKRLSDLNEYETRNGLPLTKAL
jgi:hypothetical protein